MILTGIGDEAGANIDAQITVDGVTTDLPGFVHDLVPKIARGERADLAWAITPTSYVVGELLVADKFLATRQFEKKVEVVLQPARRRIGVGEAQTQ